LELEAAGAIMALPIRGGRQWTKRRIMRQHAMMTMMMLMVSTTTEEMHDDGEPERESQSKSQTTVLQWC
jgi:hypothetical protein